MKSAEPYRDPSLVRRLAEAICGEAAPDRRYGIMEFCGGHTHAIFRFGLAELLPPNIRLVHGPGCPVCVLPAGCVDTAVRLAGIPDVVFCTYGDILRVPGSGGVSLLVAKALGADVRAVYSLREALDFARSTPGRLVVFFAVGFETTAPLTAAAIIRADRERLANFTVFCNHVLTSAAITHILESPEVRSYGTVPLDGFIGPGHVSAVIGTRVFEYFAEEYGKAVVVAGFEPVDILSAVLMIVRQVNRGESRVENGYVRVVGREGNLEALRIAAEVFELEKIREWRGLGLIPYSGLRIRKSFERFDVLRRLGIDPASVRGGEDDPGCLCGAAIRGVREPADCGLFGTVCTPSDPRGSCMVSSEGTCAAYYAYGRRGRKGREG